MSSLDADVNIILNAEDRASPEVQNAVKNMNASWRDHLNQTRAVTRQYELQNKTLFTTARAVQSVGSIVNRAISIYNSFTLTQIRLQDAARNSAEAIIDHNEAIARFGQGSPEAIKSAERMAQVLKDQKDAQDQAKLGYALMATSIIADSTRIITSVLPKMRSLSRALGIGGGAAAASSSLSAVGGLGGAAATGAGFAGAAALGGALTGVALSVPATQAIDEAGLNPFQKFRDETVKPALDGAVNQIFNFFGTTTENLLKEVQKASKGYVTFGQ